MGTPLMWATCTMSQNFYRTTLRYKHKVTLDGKLERVNLETRPWQPVLAILSLIPTTLEMLCATGVVWEFVIGNPAISLSEVVINAAIFSLTLATYSLGIIYLNHGADLCDLYFNSLIRYDANIEGQNSLRNKNTGVLHLLFRGNLYLSYIHISFNGLDGQNQRI